MAGYSYFDYNQMKAGLKDIAMFDVSILLFCIGARNSTG